MKIRNGFVSNSSSSSFICNVCGRTESGWDMELSDAEMLECKNGHTFCEKEAINLIKDDNFEPYAACSSKYCPICMFETFMDEDILKYIAKTIDIDKIKEEIKSKFKTYKEFISFIEEKK